MTMTTVTRAPEPTVRLGWTVEVELELAQRPDRSDLGDRLAVGLLRHGRQPGTSVVVLADGVAVTLVEPAGADVRDAGEALVRGVDRAVATVGAHVPVARVRHAGVLASGPVG